MGEGGRKITTFVEQSDSVLEFPCSPCDRGGHYVKAVKYCADCEENLCVTCLPTHNNFAMMQGHQVVNKVKARQAQTKQLLNRRCTKHGGKIIDVFCPDHDIVGCSTCISVDHSTCSDKRFIPDVAAGIKTSQEFKQLETEMKTLMSKMDLLKKEKGDNLQSLYLDREELMKQIQFVRKKMNDQLDEMEKDLLAETEAKFTQIIDAIHNSLAETDDMLAKVQHVLDKLDNTNDPDTFVSCKLMRRQLAEEFYPLLERAEKRRSSDKSFKLHIPDNTFLIMDGTRSFASVKEKLPIHDVEFNADYYQYHHIYNERRSCDISAMLAPADAFQILIYLAIFVTCMLYEKASLFWFVLVFLVLYKLILLY